MKSAAIFESRAPLGLPFSAQRFKYHPDSGATYFRVSDAFFARFSFLVIIDRKRRDKQLPAVSILTVANPIRQV